MYSPNALYAPGTTEVWYAKRNGITYGIDGYVLMATLAEKNLETVYSMMQGEAWSPKGEGRDWVVFRFGPNAYGHTSMSMGDIIRTPEGTYRVSGIGFETVPETFPIGTAEYEGLVERIESARQSR